MGRRVLITGLGTFWGGRVAQALEQDPTVDVIIGLDRFEPSVPLERTEFVRVDQSYSILARIVKATQVDTIVHTFLVVDSTTMSGRTLHEINVIGTMNLLAAAGAAESSVRHVIVKSSGLVYGSSKADPQWFKEETRRSGAPRTRLERSLIEVEGYLRDFAEDNPHVTVSLLRFANVLGTDIETSLSKLLVMPAAPCILGFDPMLQFVEEGDVVRAIEFAIRSDLAGIFNVAADGRLPWSEVAAICNRRLFPVPPVMTELLTSPLARLGVLDLGPETIELLRYGRGHDNRRFKQAGFKYRYTSAGAVEAFARAQRLRQAVGTAKNTYRYEQEVEAFFKHSPSVLRTPE